MTPAFSQWMESLSRRHRNVRAFLGEWQVLYWPSRDVAATDDSLRAMGSFQCVECALWMFVDKPVRTIAIKAAGRVCLRCSGIAMPHINREGR